MQINKVMLLGRVGKDPDVRYFENNKAVASFPLATSETYKKDGEKITLTQWHNIVVWNRQAEIIEQYVKKGSELYIEGKLRTRTWEDKEGHKRYITEVVAGSILLGRHADSTDATTGTATAASGSKTSSTIEGENTEIHESNAALSLDDNLEINMEEGDDLPF